MFYSPVKFSSHAHRATVRPEDPKRVRRIATREEIAKLAYSYWEAGGRREGTAMADWLRAERALDDR
ncbi:MAG: DUF2934 domain-containing protein [Ignavibacteriota bacterium]